MSNKASPNHCYFYSNILAIIVNLDQNNKIIMIKITILTHNYQMTHNFYQF
jgi:hypothetical protein